MGEKFYNSKRIMSLFYSSFVGTSFFHSAFLPSGFSLPREKGRKSKRKPFFGREEEEGEEYKYAAAEWGEREGGCCNRKWLPSPVKIKETWDGIRQCLVRGI